MQFANPFQTPGRWLKSNFHTHTTASDGDRPLSERAAQYREKGYNVLAVTDHEKTNDVAGLSAGDFLVMSGMETHPACPGAVEYHLVCLNVPHGLQFAASVEPNERIRKVRELGGEVIIAHPYWCGHNLNHLLALTGAVGVEVFNATCTKIGKGISSVQWDDLLDAGRILPASACDDTHGGRDIFMGWTMIKAQSLTVAAVMEALRSGCYYSSCGPVIEDFAVKDGLATVRCSPAAEIHFISRRYRGGSFYADDGPDLVRAQFPIAEADRYLRVEVVDRRGNRAWTNPLMLS